MKQIETSLKIDAPAADVWSVLMDFASYPHWNPMIVDISGTPRVGSRLEVRIAMKNGRRMTFRPTVVEYEEGRRFAWLGRLGVRGLFDGRHSFAVEDGGSTATLLHGEEFRGLLPPFLGKVLADTHDSIVAMNEALALEVQRRRHGRR